MEKNQVKQLKLNVTNIRSVLVNSNKKLNKIRIERNQLTTNLGYQKKSKEKEKKIEKGGIKSTLSNIKNTILSGPMSIFDKILEFFGILLLGIVVNNLPQILSGLQKFFDSEFIKGVKSFIGAIVDGTGKIINFDQGFSTDQQNKTISERKEIDNKIDTLKTDLDKFNLDIEQKKKQVEQNQRNAKPPMPGLPPSAAQPGTGPSGNKVGSTPQKRSTGGSISARQTSGQTGRERRARQSVNYFETFNQTVTKSKQNTIADKKNIELFEEMTSNFKEFTKVMDKISPMTPPGDNPVSENEGPPIIDGKIYESEGGEKPSKYPGRGINPPSGQNTHGYPARDYAIGKGTPVSVFIPGEIEFAGIRDPNGYGNEIVVRHTNGQKTRYAHLSQILVKQGDKIETGQSRVIGKTGGKPGDFGAGRTDGEHLHFELLDASGNKITNYNTGDNYFRFGGNIKVKESKLITTSSLNGEISWYGPGFYGKKTANGETFTGNDLTAAHKTLPFGTKVRITSGSRSIIVRINDRGPFKEGRVIDLSRVAMEQLRGLAPGTLLKDPNIGGVINDAKIEVLGTTPSKPGGGPNISSLKPSPYSKVALNKLPFLMEEDSGSDVILMAVQPVEKYVPLPYPIPIRSA